VATLEVTFRNPDPREGFAFDEGDLTFGHTQINIPILADAFKKVVEDFFLFIKIVEEFCDIHIASFLPFVGWFNCI